MSEPSYRFSMAKAPLDAAWAAVLEPRLAPWVSPELASAVVDHARTLPRIWRWGMFEVGLDTGVERCDFMTCLANVADDAPRASEYTEHPALAVGQRLLRPWCRDAQVRAALPMLWFEWDMSASGPQTALASVCLDPSFLSAVPGPSRSTQIEWIGRVLDWSIDDSSLRSCIARGIERCLRELPEPTALLHLASLDGRGDPGVRLTLGLQPSELLRWLRAIGWPGDLVAVSAWCRDVAVPWQRLFVQVELAEQLRGYLGIETRLGHGPLAQGIEDALVGRASADSARVTALRAWTGRERSPHEPDVEISLSSYVKVAPFDGRALCAKAYLGFNSTRAVHPA